MSDNTERSLDDLAKVVEELKSRLIEQEQRMEQELARLRSAASQKTASAEEKPTSRRRLLKKLAAGAALATAASAAALVGTEPPTAQAQINVGGTGTPGTAGSTYGFTATTGNYVVYQPVGTPKYFGLIGTTDAVANVPPEPFFAAGVFGSSVNGKGVLGRSAVTDGVFGQTDTAANTAGVSGYNSVADPAAVGVYGTTAGGGAGVKGATTGSGGSGVYGTNTGGGSGVYGTSTGGGNGVRGVSNGSGSSNGVVGTTDVGQGVFGLATGTGGYGVLAQANGPNGYGLIAAYYGPAGNGAPIFIQPGSGGVGGGPAAGEPGAKVAPQLGSGPEGPPTANFHNAGEIVSDSKARLYYNTVNGTSGIWGQLAPVVYLPSPIRLYGNPFYGPDPTVAASNYSATPPTYSPRYLKVEGTWINGLVGAFIPNNATAIIGTLVAYNSPAFGFVTVYPANAAVPTVATMVYGTGFTSSTINVSLGLIPAGDPNAGKLGVGVVSFQPINITFDVIAYLL